FTLLPRPPPTSTLFPYTTLFRSHRPGKRSGDRTLRPRERVLAEEPAQSVRGPPARRGRSRDFALRFAHPRGGAAGSLDGRTAVRSEEHTSELQSRGHLVCRLLLE